MRAALSLMFLLCIACRPAPSDVPAAPALLAPAEPFAGTPPEGPANVAAAPVLAAAPAPREPSAGKPEGSANAAKTPMALEAAAGVAPSPCREVPSDAPPGLYRDDPSDPGRVVLTFDDGPYPDKTAGVLDALREHRFRATFFVLGRHITRRTYALLQRMEAEGHAIGSHSYDHDIRMAWSPTPGYIRGQHEITRVLIELSLLARSGDDFDALYRRVMEASPERRLPNHRIAEYEPILARHRALLEERGHAGGRYHVVYSRPPGGGPYLGTAAVPRARYDAALAELGMLNVMWHGDSGDVHASLARDRAFLRHRMVGAARRGGVLLIHDFIRLDALTLALADLAREPIEVVPIDAALADKYGCPSSILVADHTPSDPTDPG